MTSLWSRRRCCSFSRIVVTSRWVAMRHYIYNYLYIDTHKSNYQILESTLNVLHASLVSVCWEITRTIQGIGSARVLFQSCPETASKNVLDNIVYNVLDNAVDNVLTPSPLPARPRLPRPPSTGTSMHCIYIYIYVFCECEARPKGSGIMQA